MVGDDHVLNTEGRSQVYVTQLLDCLISAAPMVECFRNGSGVVLKNWFCTNLLDTYEHGRVLCDKFHHTAYQLYGLIGGINVFCAHNGLDGQRQIEMFRELGDMFNGNADLDKLKKFYNMIYSRLPVNQQAKGWSYVTLSLCDYMAVHQITHKGRSPWLQIRDGLHQGPIIKVSQWPLC